MTDYSTLASVKQQLGASETTDDILLASLITAASRIIDRYCAGTDSDDYFAARTVADDEIQGMVSADGVLLCWPMTARVNSVLALAYRYNSHLPWMLVNVDDVEINGYSIRCQTGLPRGRVRVKASYTCGYAAIPADIADACTLLAIRLYREGKSGVTDAIGIAELGTMQYTRALPTRVVTLLNRYRRVV